MVIGDEPANTDYDPGPLLALLFGLPLPRGGALVFGPMIWREHRRLWRKGATNDGKPRKGARRSRQLCPASVPKRLLPLDEATAVSSKVS
jgi:hypothetical protein